MQLRNILIITLLVVIAIGAISFTRALNNQKEAFEKILLQEKEQKEKAIDSLTKTIDGAETKIDSIESVKQQSLSKYWSLMQKLKQYEKPRYYADATFDTESMRITESHYRHREQDSTVGQGKDH